MHILVVAPWLPYPETWGSAIRVANTIRGLARLGDIDLFVIAERQPQPSRTSPRPGACGA